MARKKSAKTTNKNKDIIVRIVNYAMLAEITINFSVFIAYTVNFYLSITNFKDILHFDAADFDFGHVTNYSMPMFFLATACVALMTGLIWIVRKLKLERD
jgi:hypothetical protein